MPSSIPTSQDSLTPGGSHWLPTESALDSILYIAARDHVLTTEREKALPPSQT